MARVLLVILSLKQYINKEVALRFPESEKGVVDVHKPFFGDHFPRRRELGQGAWRRGPMDGDVRSFYRKGSVWRQGRTVKHEETKIYPD